MLSIDRYASTPVYLQLVEQFTRYIAAGVYRPGEALPSVRTLSTTLNVNPNTLQKAYSELESRGLCCSSPGSGRYISPDAHERLEAAAQKELNAFEKLCLQLKEAGVGYLRLEEILKAVYEGRNA